MKRILSVAILLLLTFTVQAIEATHGGRIPHCGDRCDVEGAGGGCVYYGSGGQLVRVPATCRNGAWTPSP